VNHVPESEAARAAATYRNDVLRAPFYGILEAGWSTFALLIAIRHFDAPETYKAFFAGAWPIGFLLTPLLGRETTNSPQLGLGQHVLASRPTDGRRDSYPKLNGLYYFNYR
jgi:hypothetical protein